MTNASGSASLLAGLLDLFPDGIGYFVPLYEGEALLDFTVHLTNRASHQGCYPDGQSLTGGYATDAVDSLFPGWQQTSLFNQLTTVLQTGTPASEQHYVATRQAWVCLELRPFKAGVVMLIDDATSRPKVNPAEPSDHPLLPDDPSPGQETSSAVAPVESVRSAPYHFLQQMPNPVAVLTGPDFIIEMANSPLLSLWGKEASDVIGQPYFSVFPAGRHQEVDLSFRQAYQSGQPVTRLEVPVSTVCDGQPVEKIYTIVLTPLNDEAGTVAGILCAGYDITDNVRLRNQAEAKERLLEQTKDQLEVAMSAGRIGIAHWDVQQNRITWNRQQEAIYGLEEGEFGGHMDDFLRFILPEDLPAIQAANQKAMTERGDYTVRFRIRRKDGVIRWIESHTRNQYDKTGALVYVTGTNTDITEHQHAQTALKESRERLQASLDASLTGTFRWNIQTNELSWDSNLDRLFGMPPGSTVQSLDNFIERVHPHDRQGVIDACLHCANGGTEFNREFRVVWPDGSLHWLDDKGKTHFDEAGKPLYMTGACVDITAHKRALEQLKYSEERFGAAVAAVQGILWTNNAQGEMEGLQPGWAALTGQTFEQYQGYGWSMAVHPDDAQPTVDAWNEAVSERKPFIFEHRVKRKDGTWGHFSIRAIPVFNQDGLIREWVGVHSDITEQKTFAERLEHEVAQRTEELVQANTELIRSNDYLQQFAYVASHDLQEPLRKIQSFGDILLSQYEVPLGETGRNLLHRMQSASTRMSELVRDLLAYSRLTTQQQPFEPVALNEVVDTILSDLELRLRDQQAHISVASLPTVRGDSTQMQQLFGNLIGNAIKYVTPGVAPQVQITCRTVPAQALPPAVADALPATATPDKRKSIFHEISVTDNGIGFDEKYLDRIFGMFQRLVGRSQYEGSGMGLAICKRVAENHHGAITARSRPGEGTTFLVYLPA